MDASKYALFRLKNLLFSNSLSCIIILYYTWRKSSHHKHSWFNGLVNCSLFSPLKCIIFKIINRKHI